MEDVTMGPYFKTPDRPGKIELFQLFALMSAAALLLVFRIDHPFLWKDEVFSINYIRHDFGYLLDLHREAERHPPGHYLTLKAWGGLFGDGRAAMRGLSVAFAVLCLPLTYLIVRPVLGARVALLSVLFLAVFPGFVHYGREARMYAQLFFFLTLATWFFTFLLYSRERAAPGDNGNVRRVIGLVGFSVALAATFYTHYAAAIFYACFFVATVWVSARENDRRLLALGAVGLSAAVLLAVPQILHMLRFLAPSGDEWIEATSLRTLYQTVLGCFPFPWWAKPVMALLYLWGTVLIWRADRRFGVLFLCIPVMGITALAVIGVWRPMLLVRTAQPLTLLTPVALAMVVARLPRPAILPAVVALVAVHALAFRVDYPASRQTMIAEEMADRLGTLTPGSDKVFYIEHLAPEFDLFRVSGRADFVPIRFDAPEAQFPAIRSRLVACHRNGATATGGCGTTIVIMEREPRFEKQAARAWFGFLDQLAEEVGKVRREENSGYVVYSAGPEG